VGVSFDGTGYGDDGTIWAARFSLAISVTDSSESPTFALHPYPEAMLLLNFPPGGRRIPGADRRFAMSHRASVQLSGSLSEGCAITTEEGQDLPNNLNWPIV